MDNAKGMQIPDSLIEQELNKDDGLRQASLRLQNAREYLSEERSRAASDKSPSVRRATERVRNLEDDIEDRKSELRQQIAEHVAGMSDGSGNFTLPALELERDALKANLEVVMTALDKQIIEVQKLDRFSADLEAKKAELDELRQIISKMSTELKFWKVELEAAPRITVIEPATRPQTNDAIRKYVGVMVAALLGFGLVLFGVAYVEFQSRRVNSTSDINEGLGIRVMGDLPPLGGRNWRALRNSEDPQGALQALLAESIDGVRTTLIHSAAVRSPRVVMVTSAESHEGKTTVASQLAASLARSGRRTLLVDGDLRNPAAHRVFDMPQEPGLCDMMRGQIERDIVIQPTRTANLWLLPAGRCCVQSIQALSNENIGNLLTQLKSEYEFIVIDSAPVLTVADPLLLGQHVDAVVISVLRDHSKVPKVYEACERLKSVGITVLGAVVNGVREQALRPTIVDMQAMEPAETA
jgi:capsular exopolysaccharide synthesis family protein